MIFYFTATGNSKYVANRLAQATGEEAISMTECLGKKTFDFSPADGERIGFVTPTYFGGLPIVVTDFMARVKLNLSGEQYTYHVLTYGTMTGYAHFMMNRCLGKHGLPLLGRFIVRMVDTWTPMFDLSDAERNRMITEAAEAEISGVTERIVRKAPGDFDNRKLPRIIAAPFYAQYRNGKPTRDFTVEDSCTGCGLCARMCPVGAIEMRDNRPSWTKERCAICLGCLHRCPAFAIQYGKNTRGHGQFVNPNVKL